MRFVLGWVRLALFAVVSHGRVMRAQESQRFVPSALELLPAGPRAGASATQRASTPRAAVVNFKAQRAPACFRRAWVGPPARL